jgi:hypothetical protein
MKNAGEIEIAFDRRMKDRLKVILAIDNGGWSMDPYVSVVQTLFDYARAQFKEVKTYFFHNTIYDTIWEDAARYPPTAAHGRAGAHGSRKPADRGGRRQHGPLRIDVPGRLHLRPGPQRPAQHRMPGCS